MISHFKLEGNFFDNKTSRKTEALLSISDDGTALLLVDGKTVFDFTIDVLKISDRIANTTREITFPDGSTFETLENDIVDEIMKHFNIVKKSQFLYFLETGKKYVVASTILLIITLWFAVVYGIPMMAKEAAFLLPASSTTLLGDEVLEMLDKGQFDPTALSKKTRKKLSRKFSAMLKDIPESDVFKFDLKFRKGGILGANAFALPNGSIIVTDELVKLSKNDNELISIFAHEIGHVVHRHGLRLIIQDSVIGLVIITLTGDVLSTSSLAAALPAILIKGGYSRDFEREADKYSYDYLKSHKIKTRHFISILNRLQKEHNPSGSSSLLSTHPSTDERVQLFKE